LSEHLADGDRIYAMIAEGLLPTGDGALHMLFVGADGGFISNELPAASFLLALVRIRQTLQ
jgi:hypothetical protein